MISNDLELASGKAHEGNHVIRLLSNPRGLTVEGDKGFDSYKLRKDFEALGASHCFPGKSNRKKQRKLNKRPYCQRYRVENFICRLKRWACAVASRDKLALHYLALILFVSVIDRLTRRP